MSRTVATPWGNKLSSLRRIAFDTNALIYLLEEKEPYASYVGQAVARLEKGQVQGSVSTVVEMELLVKPLRDGNNEARDKAEIFLRDTRNLAVHPVDRLVARRAADVRARVDLDPLDAIIVATALEERCDAIIGNDSTIAFRRTGIPYLYLDDYI